jgi:hypothetical protein
MRKPADGARAGGSDRDEAYSIHMVLGQEACQGMCSGLHMAGISGTHKGIVKRRNTPNDTILRQLVQPIERKDNIPVLLKAGAIKVRRDVAHHQVMGRNVVGDDTVIPGNGPAIARCHGKGTVITAVQARRGDESDAPLRQRRDCYPGLGTDDSLLPASFPHLQYPTK